MWRINDCCAQDRASLRSAIALCVLGLGSSVLGAFVSWTVDGVHVQPNVPLERAVIVGAAIAVAGVPVAVDRRRRAWALLGIPILLTTLVALVAGGPVAGHVAEGAVVVGWLTLARVRLRSSAPGRRDAAALTAAAMTLMAAGEGIRLVTVLAHGRLMGVAPGVDIAAAVLAGAAALVDLTAAWRTERGLGDLLSRELTTTRSQLHDARDVERERLHDARSAIAGVIGASSLLTQPLPTADRENLQRLIDAELTRLAHVLDSESAERCEAFDLAAALESVVRANRLQTVQLDAELGSAILAWGRPRATAGAVDNVLRNARVHAPQAAVSVTVRHRGGAVDIVIDDDGPGIPASDRVRVLGRGVRGTGIRSVGTGLGLHIAASAMTAQGGALELHESPPGGLRVVLTLPTASTRLAPLTRVAG